jgi:hypothetical protein
MLLEEHSRDFPNRLQKQRAQFLKTFLKRNGKYKRQKYITFGLTFPTIGLRLVEVHRLLAALTGAVSALTLMTCPSNSVN